MFETDLRHLLSTWKLRLLDSRFDTSYQDALNDCIFELTTLLDENFLKECAIRSVA